MKVILVNGSPHERGCTDRALREVAAALESEGVQTEMLWIGRQPVSGCTGCGACRKLKKCVIDGDGVNDFIRKAQSADGFVFGSPVHYASAGGAMTSFLDRAFYSGGAAMKYKPGAAVVSCRRAGASATFDMLNKFFELLERGARTDGGGRGKGRRGIADDAGAGLQPRVAFKVRRSWKSAGRNAERRGKNQDEFYPLKTRRK